MFVRGLAAVIGLFYLLAVCGVQAKSEGGSDVRAAAQNPVASMYSIPFKFTFDNGAANGDANILSINPVIPFTVADWNLVNRFLIPMADVDGPISGLPPNPSPIPGNGASGLGDINWSLYFSPVKYDKVIWGVGPSLSMPTASNDQLGTGKWSLGATAVALTQPKWGSFGILGRQLWSVGGDSDRRNVNQTLLEPFGMYNLEKGWYLMTDMIVTANWEADSKNRWTVPFGGGVGRVFKIGDQPVNTNLQAYYNVGRPDGAPEWSLSFVWTFLFPR